MNKEITSKVESIKKLTGIRVNSSKIINTGAESLIIEINDKWIFRFPRNHCAYDILRAFALLK